MRVDEPPAGVGEPVDLAPLVLPVLDEPLRFQPREPRVDGPGRRRVEPEETVLERADHVVPVTGTVLEQPQQVEPELAVAEDRAHARSRPTRAMSPETVLPDSSPAW